MVMAKWTGRNMPTSRWVGELGPFSAELEALFAEIERKLGEAGNRVAEDADPDPRVSTYLASLTDAQLVAEALGVKLSY